jgi:hypothetical protein
MTIDAKDVALAGAAVGGILLISARTDAGGRKRRRRRKGGGGGSGGGGATPGPAGVIPVPVPGDGGGGGPVNLPGSDGSGGPSVSVPDDVQRARTLIDAARGTGEAAEATLDAGSGGVDFVADVIGGDDPGAFSTTGGLTGASYEAGQLTRNVADTVADTVAPPDKSGPGRDPLGVGNAVGDLLGEGPL